MKRLSAMILVLLISAGALFAQQITRVAVIDMQKVYLTYYKDSQAVRAFEDEKQRVQNEITRLQDEIKALQSRRLELQRAGDTEGLRLLDDSMKKKLQYLQDYIRIKQTELDDKATTLSQSESFAQLLFRTIQSTAEFEGYSLVLSVRNVDAMGTSVLWFSPMVDITDKVIQALVGSR